MTPHEQIKEKILSLQSALLEQHPSMPVLLQDIHRALKNDPAIVTLMTEEEIAVIVSGLKTHTSTVIVTAAAKSGPKASKSLAKVTVDDLF